MFRRGIFYGITLILLVIVIFLLMRGRNDEKERRAAHNSEMVKIASALSSPVRAILPRDLEIVTAETEWTRNSEEKDATTARHNITIRNTGGGAYIGICLRMEYIDEKGLPVEIRTHEVKETVSPGETLRMSDIIINDIPDTAFDFHVTILSADLKA